MPKVTITFDLPEEAEEFKLASAAGSLHSVIWDLDNEVLRNNLKHGDGKLTCEEIRTKLWDILGDYDLTGFF